jgi:hypothetical protein
MTLEGRRVVQALIGERKNRTLNVRIVIKIAHEKTNVNK